MLCGILLRLRFRQTVADSKHDRMITWNQRPKVRSMNQILENLKPPGIVKWKHIKYQTSSTPTLQKIVLVDKLSTKTVAYKSVYRQFMMSEASEVIKYEVYQISSTLHLVRNSSLAAVAVLSRVVQFLNYIYTLSFWEYSGISSTVHTVSQC